MGGSMALNLVKAGHEVAVFDLVRALAEPLEAAGARVASSAGVSTSTAGSGLSGSASSIVTGGTDTHVLLVDLRPKGVKGNATEKALGRAHITCNKNGVPFDDEKPTITSGIRLGTPAGTTRGFGEPEFRQIADWIIEVTDGLAANGEDGNDAVEAKVKGEVAELCARFPLYPNH